MINSEVRYLSVLEGGYDLPAIERSAVSHVKAMLSSYKPPPSIIKPIISTIDHLMIAETKIQENLIDKAINHIISPHLKDDNETIDIINTIKSYLPEDSLLLQDIHLYDPITIVESNTITTDTTTNSSSNVLCSSDRTSITTSNANSVINNTNTTLNVPSYTCRKDGEVLALREILEEMGLND